MCVCVSLPAVTVMLSMSDMVLTGLQFVITGGAQLVVSVSMSNLLKRRGGKDKSMSIFNGLAGSLQSSPSQTWHCICFSVQNNPAVSPDECVLIFRKQCLTTRLSDDLNQTVFLHEVMLRSVLSSGSVRKRRVRFYCGNIPQENISSIFFYYIVYSITILYTTLYSILCNNNNNNVTCVV